MFLDEPHKVKWFGIGLTEDMPQQRARQALDILRNMIARCRDEDVSRDPEMLAALDYLAKRTRPGPCVAFKLCMMMVDQDLRVMRATELYRLIASRVPQNSD